MSLGGIAIAIGTMVRCGRGDVETAQTSLSLWNQQSGAAGARPQLEQSKLIGEMRQPRWDRRSSSAC